MQQQLDTQLFNYFGMPQNNKLTEIHRYFKQFVNIIVNNIDNFIQTYVIYEKNDDFLMPGPYDDIDGSTLSNSYHYDGYNGYDN